MPKTRLLLALPRKRLASAWQNREIAPHVLLLMWIVLGAAARLLPHPPNVTPLTAMALMGGIYARSLPKAILLPLGALLLSDLALELLHGYGWHALLPLVYACFLSTVLLGRLLRHQANLWSVQALALFSSLLFFAATNLGVWAQGELYPQTPAGLLACFIAALPFLRNALLGDQIFTLLAFTGSAWLLHRPWLALSAPKKAV